MHLFVLCTLKYSISLPRGRTRALVLVNIERIILLASVWHVSTGMLNFQTTLARLHSRLEAWSVNCEL